MKNQFLMTAPFVLLIVLVLLTIFGIVYIYVTSRTKERLALIEKGMDPNLANSDFWVQVGIIGGGAALGLIAGDKFPDGYGSYGPLMAIILPGAGLVIYNVLKKKKMRTKL